MQKTQGISFIVSICRRLSSLMLFNGSQVYLSMGRLRFAQCELTQILLKQLCKIRVTKSMRPSH